MKEKPKVLDLKLWLDKDIIPRQNKLKAIFWEILAEAGNSMGSAKLSQIHPPSRGVKLSKGSDLLGYPYQVLDLIRDFDPDGGINIRVLNWFGHGLFIFVLFGKCYPKDIFDQLRENDWSFDKSSTPWDYPGILLYGESTNSPTINILEKSSFYQWHKAIPISEELTSVQMEIINELNKLIFLLSQKMG